jgi:signal peptidase II
MIDAATRQAVHRAAAVAIVLSFLLDVLIKRLILAAGDSLNGLVLIPGLLDLQHAWNSGVSFSFLWQSTATGSAVLALSLAVLALAFAIAAFRAERPLVAAGFGLIVGGAVGNLTDRVFHGAVFDFLVMRIGSQPLFVCNSADIFISLGLILWLADMLLTPRTTGAAR